MNESRAFYTRNKDARPNSTGITAIVYYSEHHGNTKKVLDAIKESDSSIELIDVTDKHEVDLNGYDRIGAASGIYFGKFAEKVQTFLKINLPTGKDVFFIATAGNPIEHNFNSVSEVIRSKHCNEIGRFQCKGFDTFGPLKLVGGLQKGHPDDNELNEAVEFYRGLPTGRK